MGELGEYLRYLKRDDVREVMLQSERVVAVRLDSGMRPLTKEQLETSSIVELLIRAGLSSSLPAKDTRGTPEMVQIGVEKFDVVVARQGNTLQARFSRAGSWTNPDAPQHPAGPAPEEHPAPEMEVLRNEPIAPAPPSPPAAEQPVAPRAPSSPMSINMPPRAGTQPGGATGPLPSHPPQAAHPAAQTFSMAPKSAASTVPPALEALLRRAREMNASDLHLSAENQVRFRAVGRLVPEGEVLSAAEVDAMLSPLLVERQASALKETGYADFALHLEGIGRLRVNVNKQRTGLKGCFRLIAPHPSTIAELGLPAELRKITNYHQGLVVVSGPNGQGKTTTMAALVDLVNESRAYHVITVEDPVEVLHPIKKAVMSQRQVGEHTNSFYAALKGALREDPDVIIIGELRDKETVEMALSAAETGHLVIATMSTPSASKTIDRLIDMFPPDDQAQVRATLAGALKLVISQRLVPSVDGTRQYAAAELITGGIPLWNLIRDNKLYQLPSLQQRGRNFGMIRMDDSLNELLNKKLISLEVAQHNAVDRRAIGQPSVPPASSGSIPPPSAPESKKRGFFS